MENQDGFAPEIATAFASEPAAVDAGGDTRTVDTEIPGLVEESHSSNLPARVGLGELTDWELLSIKRCVDSVYYNETFENIIADIHSTIKACFRLDPGLMILEIVHRGQDKELYVFWLEAENMFRQGKMIELQLKELARANGCNLIGANFEDERFARFFCRFGGKITGYCAVVEV